MTIAYQADVSTSTLLGFWKLVVRWRGSVYKLILKELLVYGLAYTTISLFYRNLQEEAHRRLFEQIAIYSDRALEHIPLSFVLGFYVTFVAGRWWDQFTCIPWPDKLAHVVLTYVVGGDDTGRLLRRTLMRYANLGLVLVLQAVSGAVKKRFPSSKHLVDAGFMTSDEMAIYENMPNKANRHWLPHVWFANLVNMAVQQGRLQQGPPVKHILEELNHFHGKCSLLWCYDWVTVPLVYTQVSGFTRKLDAAFFSVLSLQTSVPQALHDPRCIRPYLASYDSLKYLPLGFSTLRMKFTYAASLLKTGAGAPTESEEKIKWPFQKEKIIIGSLHQK